MIEPGNMKERPRGLDRATIMQRVINESVTMCTESIDLELAALDLQGNSRLEEGAGLEILDRLAITRAQIDIMSRIIKRALGDEVHDGD